MKAIIGASLALLCLGASGIAQTPPATPDAAQDLGKTIGEERRAGPAKSARFRLQVGHVFLGLTCPDDEPLKACAEFVTQLLDKAESMQKR